MSEDVDKGYEKDCWQVFPVEVENIFYEVNDWNRHDYEEYEHRYHREEAIKDRVE